MLERHRIQKSMDSMLDGFPADLRPLVKKIGTGYEAHYRVPWGVRTVKCEDGKPKRFDTAAQAFVSATGALLVEFRDKTNGCRNFTVSKARMEAEALFSGKAESAE